MTDPRWLHCIPSDQDALSSIMQQAPAYPQALEIRHDSQTPYTLSPNIDPALDYESPDSPYNGGLPDLFVQRQQPFPTFQFSSAPSLAGTSLFPVASTSNASYNAEYPPLPGLSPQAVSLPYAMQGHQSGSHFAGMAHGSTYWPDNTQSAPASLSYAQATAPRYQGPVSPLLPRSQTFRLEHYVNTDRFEESPQIVSPSLVANPVIMTKFLKSPVTIPAGQQRSIKAAVQSMQLQVGGPGVSNTVPPSPSVRSTGSRRSTLTRGSRRSSRAGRHPAEWKCRVCDKILPTRVKLEHHARSHDQRFKFSCRPCDIYFEKEADLNHHDKNVHSDDNSKIYRCPECELGFLWRPYLTRHMVKHTGAKPFKCLICIDNRQTRYDNLRRHYRTAHNGQPFPTIEQCRVENATSDTNSNATVAASSVDSAVVYHQPGAMHLAVPR